MHEPRCRRVTFSCAPPCFVEIVIPFSNEKNDSGYHYQRCQALEYIPFAERSDQIVILAKSAVLPFFLSNFYRYPYFHCYLRPHSPVRALDPLAHNHNSSSESEYLHNPQLFVDPASFYTRLKNVTGDKIITNAILEEGYPIPEGLSSVGLLPSAEYDKQLVRPLIPNR
jgi:alpha-1,3(6)-mannosylglycoprotein beta-1,6-N-acetyl-glucosaminyltransferase